MKIILFRLFCIIIFAPIGIPAIFYAIFKVLISDSYTDDWIERFAVWYADKIED